MSPEPLDPDPWGNMALHRSAAFSLRSPARAMAWCGDESLVIGRHDGITSTFVVHRDGALSQLPSVDSPPNGPEASAPIIAMTTLGPTMIAAGDEAGGVTMSVRGDTHRIGMREPISALAFEPSGSGTLAIAAGHDVIVVDATGATRVAEWYRFGSVASLSWIRDDVVALGGHGGVNFLATGPDIEIPVPDLVSPGFVLDMALNDPGDVLAVADLRGEVRLTDLDTGVEHALNGFGDRVRGVAWAGAVGIGGNDVLAVAAADELMLWSGAADSDPEPWLTVPLDGPAVGPGTSHDRRWVAAAGHDGTVAVVDTAEGRVGRLDTDSEVAAMAWSPSADAHRQLLAVATTAGDLQIVKPR